MLLSKIVYEHIKDLFYKKRKDVYIEKGSLTKAQDRRSLSSFHLAATTTLLLPAVIISKHR